jgi:DNA-binding NarL/FixJ family response regulator
MPRVLIVDHHPIVRMGVRAMLEQAPGFEVCGEAGSTVEALRLLSAENPDVTLLDLIWAGAAARISWLSACAPVRGHASLSCRSNCCRALPVAQDRRCASREHQDQASPCKRRRA